MLGTVKFNVGGDFINKHHYLPLDQRKQNYVGMSQQLMNFCSYGEQLSKENSIISSHTD
jgi:hypothetical protein